MLELQNTIINAWVCVERFLEPPLRNLDPSLFQNIILGVLAIFIPFAIVFLTDLLGSKNQRSEFEKMVLSEEVLGTKRVFWLAVIGIVFLAFFSGTDVSIAKKILAIILSVILIFLFWNPFKRILRFSEGYKPEFEISFLKSLNLSKVFRFGNKLKADRMIRAWNSFWSEKTGRNEKEFTKIFIKHVVDAIANKDYSLAVLLSQAYQKNVDKRDRFSLGYEILPQTFEWHRKFWEAEREWLNKNSDKQQAKKTFLSKYFPTFRRWIMKFRKVDTKKDEFFWNWHYFQQELFPTVERALLADGFGPHQLFTGFKKHIEDNEGKLDKLKDGEEKNREWNYITGLFSSFCLAFFESIENTSNSYEVWQHYFPKDWRVTASNFGKRIPRVILHEFVEWAQKRILKEEEYDKKLTEVVGGVFPNVHHALFPVFLVFLFSGDVKRTIQKEPSFFLVNTGISWSGDKKEEEIQQMQQQKDQSQKEETINIILDYFANWRWLTMYKEDLSEKELSDWKGLSEEKRKETAVRVKQRKLQKLLGELNSTEIMEMARESEKFEWRRKELTELIDLLIAKIGEEKTK